MHQISDESRELVVSLKAVGLTNEQMSKVMKISRSTLERRYRRELDLGVSELHAKVARTLYQKALDGDTAALIYLAKSRLGWSERSVHEIQPLPPSRNPDDYTDEELVRIIEEGG